MQTLITARTAAMTLKTQPVRDYEDPLERDTAGDATVITTRRSLVRLALVAAETGWRFAREQADTDPMTWMLAPRRLFEGRAAIDACLSRDECLRALLLHGLSIGLDADPQELDVLAAAEDDEDDGVGASVAAEEFGERRPRLWTSFLVGRDAGDSVQAFDAVIADSRSAAVAQLRARHGAAFANEVEIVEGFDASLPLAEALVSPALAYVLEQVAENPASALAEGLSVSVQQRFAA